MAPRHSISLSRLGTQRASSLSTICLATQRHSISRLLDGGCVSSTVLTHGPCLSVRLRSSTCPRWCVSRPRKVLDGIPTQPSYNLAHTEIHEIGAELRRRLQCMTRGRSIGVSDLGLLPSSRVTAGSTLGATARASHSLSQAALQACMGEVTFKRPCIATLGCRVDCVCQSPIRS